MHVLMIEDNENDYHLVSRSIAMRGDVRLERRDTLATGLTYLESHPTDALLLDMTLPDGNGLLGFDQVQARFPALPILILSGDNTEKLAVEAVRRGAQDYLVKGRVDGEALERSLRYAIERKRLAERLRQSEQHFSLLVNSVQEYAIYTLDTVGNVTSWNPGAERIKGYSTEEIIGGSFEHFFPPEALAAGEPQHILETAAREGRFKGESWRVRKDGTRFWADVVVTALHDDAGRLIGFSKVIRDVTERKRTEDRLRDSEEQFRSTFAYAAIGMALVAPDGRWLQVNQAICQLVGYAESELLAKTFQDITYPDDLESDLNHVRQLLAGEIQSYQMEKRYIHKLGHLVWVMLSVSLVRDRLGHPLHFISQIQNITERKQAEEKLTQDRDLLRTLIDSSPDYIFIKDAEGRFVLSNLAHAHAANFAPDDLVSKTAFDVFPSELAAQFHADDEQVMKSGEALVNLERSTIGKYGEPKMVLTTKIPLRDKDGHVISLVGISRDITERKQFEAQTVELATERERVKALQRFLSNMSHDLRTPLSTISTSLYLMRKNTDPQKQETHAKRAEHQILRMDKLLEELLQMEYLDRGETIFQFNLTEINAFLTPLIPEFEAMAVHKQITVEFLPGAAPYHAQVDTVELARAITNLIDNAITYTPEGGRINLRTSTQRNWAVISVEDTGIGIEASDLPHIFERFYRADEARSTETGGSGLGLPVVQKIIEAHKGRIEVESQAGQGSIFSIKLPLG